MTNTYVDALTYQNASTGMTLASQYGNIGRLAASSAGASSLVPITPLTVALNQYDSLYVTDGPNSEVLQVGSGGAAIGATSIPLQANTAFAHAGGTAYCTDGTQGSLGQAIFEASRQIEDICHQALWATTYTGEILTMPTMRASIDNQRGLHFRPRHFPITTLTSVTVEANTLLVTSYDVTQAIIDSDQQTVDIPLMAALSSGGQSQQGSPWFSPGLARGQNAWITLTYTAGFALGTLPWAVTRAAALLVSESMGTLENPFGSDEIAQNKRHVTFTLRGDQSGESLLFKRAEVLLAPYVAQSF